MKHLNKYKKFNENLSFSVRRAKSVFDSSIMDIDDIVDKFEIAELPVKEVGKRQYITNDQDREITNIIVGNKYYINHSINFEFQTSHSVHLKPMTIDDFNKSIDTIHQMNDKMNRMCERLSKMPNAEASMKMHIIDKKSLGDHVFYAIRVKETIPMDEAISDVYKKWTKDKNVININKALLELEAYYSNEGFPDADIGIDDDILDSLDEDIVPIGLFTDDEIIVIAIYTKSENTLDYKWEEIDRSIYLLTR